MEPHGFNRGSCQNANEIILTNEDNGTINAEANTTLIDAVSERNNAVDLTIIGNKKDNTIKAGLGDNTILGGKGNDVLYGNDGKDIFIYNKGDGNDKIYNFDTENDAIQLESNTSLTSAKVSKNNVIFTIGSEKITLSGAKDQKVTVIDEEGNQSSQIYGVKSITVENGDGNVINTKANKKVKAINASTRTEDVKLIGNTLANTITGGLGNDTLTGGSGKDTFIYTGGNDIITDYEVNKGKIKFNATITNSEVENNDVILTTTNGTLTIQNMANKKININNKTQTYSSDINEFANVIEDTWFIDDNFNANELDDILDINSIDYTSSNIDISNITSLNKKNEIFVISTKNEENK